MDREKFLLPWLNKLKTKLSENQEFRRGESALNAGESASFDGAIGNAKILLGALLAERRGGLLLVIDPSPGEAEIIADDFELFTDAEVLTFPILPPSVIADHPNDSEIFLSEDRVFGDRLRILKRLESLRAPLKSPAPKSSDKKTRPTSGSPLSGFLKKSADSTPPSTAEKDSAPNNAPNERPTILVTSLAAVRQPVPTREEMNAEARVLSVGQTHDRDKLIRWLLDGGFHSTSAVELPGEYSVRGHILDLYAIDWEQPVRIEYFGDEIESIRPFDTVTQRSGGDIGSVTLSRLNVSNVSGSFVDHLPVRTLVMMYETARILQLSARLDEFGTQNAGIKNGSTLAETLNALYRRPTAFVSELACGDELATVTARFDFRSVERFTGPLPSIREQLDLLPAETQILIYSPTEAQGRRLADTFRPTAPARSERLICGVGPLSAGFEWPEANIVLLGAGELFGRSATRRQKPKPMAQAIDSFIDLSPGDLVIHVSHGLAKFRGLKTITKGRQEEEHLELEFADSVTLYVPASKIALVQKYVGAGRKNVKLAKLGGKLWSRQKKEVQSAIFDLAMEMLELEARRDSMVGTAFPHDSDWQRDFDGSFPFDETPDQLTAIEAIKSDMERSRPMDRLLCGDVGFGKTEVAIRAAFKAVDAGYQAAVLVPTTILAEQHFRVFSDRMAAFPVSVAVLSRFTNNKTEREMLERLKTGELDIVIGTHRIVQNDMEFRNLGLVIIDEEQRFGVRDKEYLKKLRSMVDVLTMTATPIPRTLHFSLLGLRDISNLETPPLDRLPIQTKVIRFSPETVRRAILAELARGGQVYYLHNRVRDIEETAHKLRALVPEARIGVGHAQMSDDRLEEVMRDFVLHRYDVLLCTTIIENGLDIPTANTIFIDHADRFGLAELHQLRGRVGRYRDQAFCYLLLDSGTPMNDNAMKRLRAIEEYSHLGAGFQLALRDLEIRGAGNILGTQQSGHIALVGYEMYCDFLDAAVRALKNEPQRLKIEVEIDLPGTAVLPKNYVADQRTKIDLYRRVVRVTTPEECDQIREEMIDRFGPPPPEVERMLLHARIRVDAYRHRIRSINISEGPGGPYVAMKFAAPERIARLKKILEPLNIPLRITDEQKAYIPVPKSFFGPDGQLDSDHLLQYVLRALSADRPSEPTTVRH